MQNRHLYSRICILFQVLYIRNTFPKRELYYLLPIYSISLNTGISDRMYLRYFIASRLLALAVSTRA